MPMTTTGPVRLHYYERANPHGPRLVFVHGLAANIAFWFPQVLPALSRHCSVMAYDLRGHGRSEMPAAGYAMDDMLADLDGLIRRRDGAVHLIGHSFGGAVALQYAIQHPEKVASLVVADTRLGAFQSSKLMSDWLRPSTRRPLAEQVAAAVNGDPEASAGPRSKTTRRTVAAGTAGATRSGPFDRVGRSSASARTADHWCTLLHTTTASRELIQAAGPGPNELARIEAPVLALYGDRSDFLPSWRGLHRSVARCQSEIVPDAGHFHPRGRPDYFVARVSRFLERQPVSGS
jgi:pimeloyl-ACP methyl ester carboxylesterase